LQQELMTVEAAAAELGCSPAAVMQRIELGELVAVCIGADAMLVSKRRIGRIADLKRGKRSSHLPERQR
jgi:hypothetical protein